METFKGLSDALDKSRRKEEDELAKMKAAAGSRQNKRNEKNCNRVTKRWGEAVAEGRPGEFVAFSGRESRKIFVKL